jgi:hypothetical protein
MFYRIGKRVVSLAAMLVLVIGLAACGGVQPTAEPTGTVQPTRDAEAAATEAAVTPVPTMDTEPDKDTKPTEEPAEGRSETIIAVREGRVTFSSDQSFVSFLRVTFELPEAVSPQDITAVYFVTDSETPLSLRLYAGEGTVEKSDRYELTHRTVIMESLPESTETVIIGGVDVTKENYTITANVIADTRLEIKAGNGQKVSFIVDEHAAEILQGFTGNTFVLGIYDNHSEPVFTISDLYFTTDSGEYKIALDESSCSSAIGGAVTFELEP